LPFHPLRFLRNLRRLREIVTVLIMHGFGDFVDRMGMRRYVQLGKRTLFWWKRIEPDRRFTRAQRVRMALESLGATFIKFGQVMSTRPDLIPADVIDELEKLQEDVPPFDGEIAVRTVETELGAPVGELFAKFDLQPFAAGSLGQVHAAIHHDGTPLAVKIRRPRVVQRVERDIGLMVELATYVEHYIPEAAVFDPVGLVDHFARTIRRELCFTREGRTADEFARMFQNDATLVVPRVYWELTTDSVLTAQFLQGEKLERDTDWSKLAISPQCVAANGARIFMKQAFEFGLFHGDPHPGNFRIMPDGSIGLLDYGMIGMLDEDKREELVDLLLSITHRDVSAAVEVIQRLGQPFRPIDAPLLRTDVRDFVNNYYDVSLDRLNVGNMLSDFVGILSRHGIRCPADLMLLIRALITLEGVGRELDPRFNLAEHLAPFIEQAIRDRYSPRRIVQRFWSETKRFARLAHDVPLALGNTIDKLSRDDLRVQLEHRSLNHLITEVDRSSNRVVISMLVASLLVSTALILRSGPTEWWFTLVFFVLSALLGLWLIYGIFRSGRL
jgi:ubiquinone biosynthesis protein